MNKHIKSLPHHPVRVIAISLIVAGVIGFFGYKEINKVVPAPLVTNPNTSAENSTLPQELTLGFLVGGRINTVSVKAGESVTKGQVLATIDAGNTEGALVEAQATYATAEANYQKIINGATGTSVDVAKSAVNAAQVNLDGVTKTQNVLVTNAYANLLNSTITATSDTNLSLPAPIITGTYTKNAEGTLNFAINQGGQTGFFSITGLENGTGIVSTTTPEPILDTGLNIEFPSGSSYLGTSWTINIPNTIAPNYLVNYNAYQTALQAKTQAISNAQAALDQANASLTALVTAARPEDVATAQAEVNNAQGAVQIAEAAYENTIITAPSDGTIASVAIAPGQIATPNAPAIEFTSLTSSN